MTTASISYEDALYRVYQGLETGEIRPLVLAETNTKLLIQLVGKTQEGLTCGFQWAYDRPVDTKHG